MPRHLRAAVLWGMIPLALVGGVPAAGCICSDGHVELFCGRLARQSAGKSCCPQPRPVKQCPACGRAASSDSVLAARAGFEPIKPINTTRRAYASTLACRPSVGCCQALGKDLATAPRAVATSTVEQHEPAVVLGLPVVVLSAVAPTASHLKRLDTGPPVDRVITLRTLLI